MLFSAIWGLRICLSYNDLLCHNRHVLQKEAIKSMESPF
jgi:hypothetical protein